MEMAQLSATAQRDGEVKNTCDTVSVPLPRNGRPCQARMQVLEFAEDAAHLEDGVVAALGAEPWQLMPLTSTRISMRPRWPR